MSWFSKIIGSMDTELPKFTSLDEGLDYVLKYVRIFSEDLHEKEFYQNKRWREVRDDPAFQENLLHVFQEPNKYLRILDGDIAEGTWELSLNGLVMKFAGRSELYERAFINDDFMVLRKHGDQTSKGLRKYLYLVREPLVPLREWTDMLELMYDIYKGNTNYMVFVILFFILIAVIVFFSIV